jgi:hypothetical protein
MADMERMSNGMTNDKGLWETIAVATGITHNPDGIGYKNVVKVKNDSMWKHIIGVMLIFMVLWSAAHIMQTESSKHYPPVTCQLFGGHWTIWDGWECT